MATMNCVAIRIADSVAVNCNSAERKAWLERLPDIVQQLERRWELIPDTPLRGAEPSCSYLAAVLRANGTPAVLKVGMPHMEGAHEIQGLRFWSGNPTVQLLESDEQLGAMLLERCQPGTPLRTMDEGEQDIVISALLRRMWRTPTTPHPFRPLSVLMAYWSNETLALADCWPDAGLVREGLRLFKDLPCSATPDVLLVTDLHAGNVLRAQREPWLVIDPKPFVGDPAYDATQHLFNCSARLRANPEKIIGSFADLLGLDAERVRLWTFARAAAEPRPDWSKDDRLELARAIAP